MVVPDGGDVVEDDAGEGGTVGVVDDEGDVGVFRELAEAGDFVVGEDVAAGVGGAGDADGGVVFGEVQVVEVDAVFEAVVAEVGDEGLAGVEEGVTNALVGIADVFGDEGEEDFFAEGVGERAGEGVEEEEEGGLASVGDGDVFGGDGPVEAVAEEGGEVFDEGLVALGWVVVADDSFEGVGGIEDVLELVAPKGVHFGDVGGLAAAEHAEVGVARGEGFAEIIHEVEDAAAGGELLAEAGVGENGSVVVWHAVVFLFPLAKTLGRKGFYFFSLFLGVGCGGFLGGVGRILFWRGCGIGGGRFACCRGLRD